jgi:3-oxoacyl-[acyl-carrier-protein] synthase-3
VAAQAGELALAASGIDRADIGALLNTSVCRDYLEPSTASLAHGLMGLPTEAINFDIGNACLGFVNGMNVVASMIESGQIEHGIVVNGETSRFTMEATIDRLAADSCDDTMFREQFATLTLGLRLGRDGAVARRLRDRRQALPRRPEPRRHPARQPLHRRGARDAHRHQGPAARRPRAARQTWKEALGAFDWDPQGTTPTSSTR